MDVDAKARFSAARGNRRAGFYNRAVFNLTGSEVIFLLLVGLVVLGPERLPGVMRKTGRLYGELRRMANGFESEVRGTFKEPLDEFRAAAREVRDDVVRFGVVDTEPSPPLRPERPRDPLNPDVRSVFSGATGSEPIGDDPTVTPIEAHGDDVSHGRPELGEERS